MYFANSNAIELLYGNIFYAAITLNFASIFLHIISKLCPVVPVAVWLTVLLQGYCKAGDIGRGVPTRGQRGSHYWTQILEGDTVQGCEYEQLVEVPSSSEAFYSKPDHAGIHGNVCRSDVEANQRRKIDG